MRNDEEAACDDAQNKTKRKMEGLKQMEWLVKKRKMWTEESNKAGKGVVAVLVKATAKRMREEETENSSNTLRTKEPQKKGKDTSACEQSTFFLKYKTVPVIGLLCFLCRSRVVRSTHRRRPPALVTCVESVWGRKMYQQKADWFRFITARCFA